MVLVRRLGLALLMSALLGASSHADPSLSLEDRVAAQRAIEEVYWRHRIWPADNAQSKPALALALPEAALRARVEESLRKSIALERTWHRPISARQLQAELDRMARETKNPDLLRELFAALGNDPFLAAEILARPALSDRLLRRWGGARDTELRAIDARLDAPEATYSLPEILGTGCSNDSWPDLDSPPDANLGPGYWTGTEMIVWTGRRGDRYDPATDTWSPVNRVGAPASSDSQSAVWTGTELIVWVGSPRIGGRYNPVTDTWTPIGVTGAPSSRVSQAAAWTGSKMMIWGGLLTDESGGLYDPQTDTWTPTSTVNAPAGGRRDFSMVWTGTEVIVWGGASSNGVRTNTGGRYNPVTDTWIATDISTAPPPNRDQVSVWTGSRMLIWGGSADGTPLNPTTPFLYDPVANTWTAGTNTGAPAGRADPYGVWSGSELIVWGGNGSVSGGRYRPDTNQWSSVASAGAPLNTDFIAVVWTGSEMVVWGGREAGQVIAVNTGGRYSPSTNSWVPIRYDPSRRLHHVATWTGAEMLVWGGATEPNAFGVALNDGSRYDPATATWTPLPMAGAPSPRRRATIVWTGHQAVVWGGQNNSFVALNTGASFDPATNTWSPTSLTNAPSARVGHTAVWSGSRMVVWGGGSGLQTGGRYDPVSDNWSPTSTTLHTPLGRTDHTALWTNAGMLVWGGTVSGSATNTGGLYDPANDTWDFVATTGAPTPRARHVAVWTGTEMLVWGGTSGVSAGARYTPIGGTWVPMATTGQPSPRFNETAIWTGDHLIVWGGALNQHFDDGARYDPGSNTWQATALPRAPLPRESHSAVWDGTRMFVFGGRINGSSQGGSTSNSYGAYCSACTATTRHYRDADGDGFGAADSFYDSCDAVPIPGYANQADDCDDSRASVYTGAPELCDGLANACEAPGWPAVPANEADSDADTYRICAGDCNDGNGAIHPGATEVCNGANDDCDAVTDEDPGNVEDADGDGVAGACDNCPETANPDQLNADGDLLGNACDNCISVANADQTDTDSDGRGNVCDNCPASSNPLQDDFDLDRVGDVCDNCQFEHNPSQSNVDTDAEGDLCDLDDGLIYILSTDETHVEWQAEAGFTTWNCYEGDLSVLRATGVYTQPAAERHCGLTDPFVLDLDVPAVGAVKFALVTGVSGGVEGGLGSNSAGVPRPNTNPCP